MMVNDECFFSGYTMGWVAIPCYVRLRSACPLASFGAGGEPGCWQSSKPNKNIPILMRTLEISIFYLPQGEYLSLSIYLI